MVSVDFDKILSNIACASTLIRKKSCFDLVETMVTILAIRDGTYTGKNMDAIMTILQACDAHVAEGKTFRVEPVCYAISRFADDTISEEIVDDSEDEN